MQDKVQSVKNTSNSNSIDQLYSVSGRTDLYSKQKFLLTKRAQERYNRACKAAKKTNISVEAYILNNFDCSVEDYCGENYIFNKLSHMSNPSLSPAQNKFISKYKETVQSNMPFNIFDETYVDLLIQAYLYRQIYINDPEIFMTNFTKCNKYAYHYNVEHLPIAKNCLKKAMGVQHITSPFYIQLGNLLGYEHVRRDDQDHQVYVNVVDYMSRFLLMLTESTLKACDAKERSGDILQPTYKQLASSEITLRNMKSMLSVLVPSRTITAVNPDGFDIPVDLTTKERLNMLSCNESNSAWVHDIYVKVRDIYKCMAASLLDKPENKDKYTTEEVSGRVCRTRPNSSGSGMIFLNSSFIINQ